VEPGSPFVGESQPGQVPLHGTKQGPMPSTSQIRTRWFHASFSGNPWWENPNGSVPTHTEECEENLPVRTQIQSIRMLGPFDGALDTPATVNPLCRFIPRSGCSMRL
jgi:hypothetical protein